MTVGVYFNKNYLAENERNIGYIKGAMSGCGADFRLVRNADELDGLDVLFILGGDGTILTLAAECAKRGVKIIGINYGHTGFLAEFEPEKLKDAVNLVISGDYGLQRRTILQVDCGGERRYALNDFVIQRNTGGSHFCNTVRLEAAINGEKVDGFSADGIIVSTPTGSTAYSLSAGGSVLTPDIAAFILTPICAHSLHSRPIVYGDDSTLDIFLKSSDEPVLIADGRVIGKIGGERTVTVKKAPFTADFIIKKDNNFFNKLLLKLNKWSK